MNIEELHSFYPYGLSKEERVNIVLPILIELTIHHYNSCESYKKIFDGFKLDLSNINSMHQLPFLPVGLFKEFELLSVNKKVLSKTVLSSGTSNNSQSKIFLDNFTARLQANALNRITRTIVGDKRLPMLVIDSKLTVSNRNNFTARTAAIRGFNLFAKKTFFALKDDMTLDIRLVEEFLSHFGQEPFLIFGFTFLIYKEFIQHLLNARTKLNCNNAILIHGGGWKKMQDLKISNSRFKELLKNIFNIRKVHDYYGMVEQAGSIYFECEEGYFHSSNYSEIIIRDIKDFAPCSIGQEGLVHTMSVLPWSYPGHSILTEDIGILRGVDDCKCGKKGTYFNIVGRLQNAEIRGCSDTYEN